MGLDILAERRQNRRSIALQRRSRIAASVVKRNASPLSVKQAPLSTFNQVY